MKTERSSHVSISSQAGAMLALIFLAGCSGESTVSGKVTFDGAPLTSGIVTFHPVGSGPVGIGSIGEDGRFVVAVGTSKTLPPGEYIVTVVATEPLGKDKLDAKGAPMAPKAPKRVTPERYSNKESSDLRKTVASGANVIDLELTK